jgi:hypothetical protein
MSSERTSGSWMEPTWRRLVGSTVVLFLVILAFLVGRVRAGADPGLAREATQATQQTAPQAQGGNPNDPFAQPQTDPDPSVAPDDGSGSDEDNFGNAVPDQGGGAQSFDPPSTHVS